MLIVGLDLALRSSGWAHLGFEDGDLLATGTIATTARDDISQCLRTIAAEVNAVCADAADVFVEQPIAHRSGTTTISIGMVHGAVLTAVPSTTPIIRVGPTEVKRHATGRGNADKADMRRAAAMRWGELLPSDEADAAWVADLGRHLILAAIDDHPTGA